MASLFDEPLLERNFRNTPFNNTINNTEPQDCNNTVLKLNLFLTNLLRANVTSDNVDNLQYFCSKGYESKEEDPFTKPLPWMGGYIVVASLVCIVCMVADLLLGMKERYRIPSKYFSVNVASVMVITIAMKLTVDLSTSMPSNLDQMTKIGSIAFMCTIMAILNPSLASMNDKTLLSNIIGLAIFVITIAVNLVIQMATGVISKNIHIRHYVSTDDDKWHGVEVFYSFDFYLLACVYIGIMLFLLLISISTAIIIPSFKKVLEDKYQARRKALINEQQQQQHTGIPTVEKLTHHVTRYWVMAKSGSPQFVMSCNLLSFTSLVLCVTGIGFYVHMLTTLSKPHAYNEKYGSDYEWSVKFILWTQVAGNIIGTGILVVRGFTSMKFKVHHILRSKEFWMYKDRKQKYWTQRLYEWRGTDSHLGFLSSHRHPIRSRSFIHHTKKVVLSLCIRFPFAFEQFNRLIISPLILIMRIIIKFEDASGCRLFTTTSNNNMNDVDNGDLKKYVLQLEDDVRVQPSQKFVETISESMDTLIKTHIKRAETKQHKNLLELLGKRSNRFKGVESFDVDIDQKLNSWSVPVISLACIAIAVPDISKDSLIDGIDEALLYTRPVEKSFHSAHEFVDTRKTAMALWDDVKYESKWLKNPIGIGECGKLPRDILTRFSTAKPLLNPGVHMPNDQLIEAVRNLMHRITHSILSRYPDEIQTNERFFELLCSMIADILVACFSNIPQVIMMKCHANEIEKREASVVGAVKLLGRSTKIIEKLEKFGLPLSIDPDKRASFDEWCVHLKQSSIA